MVVHILILFSLQVIPHYYESIQFFLFCRWIFQASKWIEVKLAIIEAILSDAEVKGLHFPRKEAKSIFLYALYT